MVKKALLFLVACAIIGFIAGYVAAKIDNGRCSCRAVDLRRTV